MSKKIVPINYTNRDFSSIRSSLMEHARRYYPNTFKDFNEASFGSLMLDTVAYVGDVLSFYLDYQANETFLQTAAEYKNVLKLSETLGLKFNKAPSSQGMCQFFALVPAIPNTGAPDMRYAPRIRRGSRVSTIGGIAFTLVDDVNFSDNENPIVVAKVDGNTGAATYFAVQAEGQVVSGELLETLEEINQYKRFLKVEIPGENVTEIISVTDSEGHEYHEVPYLSQNTIYKPVVNRNYKKDQVPNLLKAITVPRRFTVEHLEDTTKIQFGYGSDSEVTSGSLAEPSNVVLRRHGQHYVSDTTFDPTKLTSTDKFGISPANTTLSIIYRINSQENVNAASNTVTETSDMIVDFDEITLLDGAIRDYVTSTIEVNNEDPIVGDISLPTVEEIKLRALDMFAAQNRVVTKQDYIAMTYAMPVKFGAVKRCTVIRDDDAFKRNLNLYVISENREGHLVPTNFTIKENLKTWLNAHRVINDTVDILDAFVINLGIEFEIIVESLANKYLVIREAVAALEELFLIQKDIGEPIVVSDYYKALKDVEDIVDVVSLYFVNKVGDPYSDYSFNVPKHTSVDGRTIMCPKDAVFELKFADADIRGAVV